MKLLQLFLYCSLKLLPLNFDSLFNTVLGQDGLIFYDVGWCSGFNNGCDVIDNVDMGLGDIVKGMGTNNQVAPSHRLPIGSSIILVHGGRIM